MINLDQVATTANSSRMARKRGSLILLVVAALVLVDLLAPIPHMPAGKADIGGNRIFVGTQPLHTESVAWGDWDADGDLDLALGNNANFSQVYENDSGSLKLDLTKGFGWQANETMKTKSVAWGDWDADGDLDLAFGNYDDASRVYENDGGTLRFSPENGLGWQSPVTRRTQSVAWGDWDGDGDLDLALGNQMQRVWDGARYVETDGENQVYENDG